MLRVVLPAVAPTLHVRSVAALDVRVAIKVVIVVDGDVVIATVPPAVIAPTPGPHRPHRDSHAEGNGHSRSVISWRWIGYGWVGVHGGAIDHRGVIARYNNDLGIGLLNHDHLLALYFLRLHLDLLVRFQVSLTLSLRPHALNSVHHI